MIKEPDSYANGPNVQMYTCPECGWFGDEDDLAIIEEHDDSYEVGCPECFHHVEEVEAS